MGNFKKMLSTPKSHLAKSGLATFLSLKCRDVIYHRNLEMETEPLLQNQEIVVAWWFHLTQHSKLILGSWTYISLHIQWQILCLKG